MKQLLLLFFSTYASICFSQTESQLLSDKYEEFVFYAKPSKTSNLSKYFAKRISPKLLNSYTINDTFNKRKYVSLTFRLDKQNKATSIFVDSPYLELNKNIQEIFKDYDIENLHITDRSFPYTYKLQILSRENNQMVIDCSSEVVYDKSPILIGCETAKNKETCFYQTLSQYIANTLSPEEIKKAKILGMLNLDVSFLINEKGQIEQINCKGPNDNLTQELNRVVALFPNTILPATRNGKRTTFFYKKTIGFQIESNNEKYKEEIEKHNDELINSSDTLLNPNSELALHFKKHINPDELAKVIMPLTKTEVTLSFSIDKNGNPINIKTNSDNSNQNAKLIAIFNKFPFEKLNIQSSNVLESYRYTLIIERYNKKVIKCNDKPFIFIPPLFDEDCEKLKNPNEVYKSLNENIHTVVKNKFIKTIKYDTKLTGIIKMSCSFQIDTNGKIINVKASAPNPIISNELEQIIKDIAKVYKPAYLNGKAITTSNRYTYRFDLGETKIDEYENLIKTPYN